jgi:hypothetical protein
VCVRVRGGGRMAGISGMGGEGQRDYDLHNDILHSFIKAI